MRNQSYPFSTEYFHIPPLSAFLCFKNDLTATQAADICGVNRNTANRYYGLLRRAILSESIREARARQARSRGGRKDAGVRAGQARKESLRDCRA